MIRKIGEKSGARIVVIGLDGASFNYLDPILKSGAVPAFNRFMQSGTSADCLSCIPPLTPPAWSTMLTGVNPGKHGIFDFLQPDDSGSFRMVDASIRGRLSFVDRAEFENIRTLSILVPYTFPVRHEPNGLCVCGLGTPSADSDFIRPHSLRDEILRGFPYLREVDPTKGQSIGTLHEHLVRHTQDTVRLTRLGMSLFPDWGLCFTVFQATDLIPHFYSRYFDPDHPDRPVDISKAPAEFRDALISVYKAIDPFLGECLDIVERDGGWVILVSDHGSQPLVSSIGKDAFLSRWLEDEGYLVTGGSSGRAKQTAKARAGSLANRLLYLAKKHTPHGLRHAANKALGNRKQAIVSGMTAVPFLDEIIWEKTRVFCAPGGYGVGLYINRSGDFPTGIVNPGAEYHELREKVRSGLKKLEIVPGVQLFKEILFREDAMWGPRVKFALDLLLLWREDKRLLDNNHTLTDGRRLDPPQIKTGTRLSWCGTHRMEGLFGIAGPSVLKGTRLGKPANLADIMPTLLFLANLPIPSDLDGKVVREAFEKIMLDSNPPVEGPPEDDISQAGGGLSESESEKLIDLLSGLGYLN